MHYVTVSVLYSMCISQQILYTLPICTSQEYTVPVFKSVALYFLCGLTTVRKPGKRG